MAFPREVSLLSGTLIALAAIPVSALLWGLFTRRWSAESRRARKLQKGAVAFSALGIFKKTNTKTDAYQEYGARVGRWL